MLPPSSPSLRPWSVPRMASVMSTAIIVQLLRSVGDKHGSTELLFSIPRAPAGSGPAAVGDTTITATRGRHYLDLLGRGIVAEKQLEPLKSNKSVAEEKASTSESVRISSGSLSGVSFSRSKNRISHEIPTTSRALRVSSIH